MDEMYDQNTDNMSMSFRGSFSYLVGTTVGAIVWVIFAIVNSSKKAFGA
jgi:hypothetical protein